MEKIFLNGGNQANPQSVDLNTDEQKAIDKYLAESTAFTDETERVLEQCHKNLDQWRSLTYAEKAHTLTGTECWQRAIAEETANEPNYFSLTTLFYILAGTLLVIFTALDSSRDSIIAHYNHIEEDLAGIHKVNLASNLAGVVSLSHKKHCQIILRGIQERLRKDPTNDVLNYYAGVCYSQLANDKRALQSFETVVNSPSQFKERAQYRMGIILWRQDEISRAKAIFKQISRDPHHPFKEKAALILKENDFISR